MHPTVKYCKLQITTFGLHLINLEELASSLVSNNENCNLLLPFNQSTFSGALDTLQVLQNEKII